MKKCIQKANIKLVSLKTPNALNDLFFHINLKISSLEKVNKNDAIFFFSFVNCVKLEGP